MQIMTNVRLSLFSLYAMLTLIMTVSFSGITKCQEGQHKQFSQSKDNFSISPYTGYTREQWLEITERIISGVLPYFNEETGLPDLAKTIENTSFDKVRLKNPNEDQKRALERIMMAVVIYTKATGKDQVPGYKGSVTAPFIKAIIKGTDPQDPFYWGDPKPNDQVGSIFAIAVYLNQPVFWDPLTEHQKLNVLNYLQKQTHNKTYDNNHYFFHMVPVSLLEKFNYEANREHLTKMYDRLFGWYRGEGWFIDGSNRGFDYYNIWGFQLFNQILYRYDKKWHDLFGERIAKNSALFLETYPFLFGKDGGPIPWGRSLSYRFADVSLIGWSVLNGTCTLPPGQARRIASGSLKYFWEHGCLGENNLLNIGYWGTNTEMAEDYIAPGDPYWATQGLSCLLIPKDDPFWTSVEEPIPSDGAGGKLAIPGAQLSIRVSPLDGEARLFPVGQPFGQDRKLWQIGVKYDQYSYSSYLGFCVTGEGGPVIGEGRSGYSVDGVNWFFRERATPILVDENHHISEYTLKISDQYKLTTHTLIGNDGEIYIFWHDDPDPLYLYMGGYGIRVLPRAAIQKIESANKISINSGGYHSVIQSVGSTPGLFETEYLNTGEERSNTHLFGGKGAFPYWKSKNPIPPLTPIIMYSNGTRNRESLPPTIKLLKCPGLLKIQFEGQWYEIKVPL